MRIKLVGLGVPEEVTVQLRQEDRGQGPNQEEPGRPEEQRVSVAAEGWPTGETRELGTARPSRHCHAK